MHNCVREVELSFGQTDEFDGTRGRIGHHQRERIGHADVLAGEDHETAGDEAGVLAGLEHAGQPVQAGIGIGTPDALDEGGHHVVVIVAAVAQRLRAEGGFDVGGAHMGEFVDDAT